MNAGLEKLDAAVDVEVEGDGDGAIVQMNALTTDVEKGLT